MNGLEQELVAVVGVSHAFVEVSGDEAATLHVELDDDADRESVASAVDVILRRHGLRSRARTVATEPIEPIPPPTGWGGSDASPVAAGPPEPEVEVVAETETVDRGTPTDDGSFEGVDEVQVGHRSGRSRVVVRTTTGREGTATAVAREDAEWQAVAAAVGDLLGTDVPPHVVEVRRQDVGSRRAVTVVLDVGDDLAIGTSFERGSGDLGLARAIWNALRGG